MYWPRRGVEIIDEIPLSATVRQIVEEMLGWSGVVMPSGTLTARCTPMTLATA